MSLLDKARAMKGDKIKVRFIGDERISKDELIIGKVYDAIHGGVGSVENALFENLIDEQGNKWSGQLNGHDGFRVLLVPNLAC
ncbi:MAG: hypothetical protein GY941_26340 [Planctomycetes bacterium]|nr:hypothetical protein [Planctomycetota bacterium]